MYLKGNTTKYYQKLSLRVKITEIIFLVKHTFSSLYIHTFPPCIAWISSNDSILFLKLEKPKKYIYNLMSHLNFCKSDVYEVYLTMDLICISLTLVRLNTFLCISWLFLFVLLWYACLYILCPFFCSVLLSFSDWPVIYEFFFIWIVFCISTLQIFPLDCGLFFFRFGKYLLLKRSSIF